ncbi:alpha/beta hydrolase [Rhodovulum sulfidophilum]|uniref:alpha/beta hydrolase n=1 Tax=Rhodovulum sulfidophilum TaxID=35806 RepID=UPI001926A81F|nr:alpha/beta hydrolase [Rhodovulum sulfidophilum]MBL3586826.1 alpha/beta hydrolase [Rhodovulum sulfidophilum]
MKFRFGGIVAFVVAMVVLGLLVWRLADQDLGWRNSEPFDFVSGGNAITGTLWLPDDDPQAAIVLVHGDGAQDRTSDDGYAPLINAFLDHGIAVAAWDKPGVGTSGGNWLHQSMPDRVDETRAALRNLHKRFDRVALGAVGFSQAGWVLPGLTRDDADFLVLIGAAVSWHDQGDYYTRVRLGREGMDREAIAQVIADRHRADDRAFGPDAQASDAPAGMTPDRWQFLRRNHGADARAALGRLDLPLLAIWGEDDLNVDARRNAAIYREILAGHDARSRIVIWPDATHGLLKANAYNWQLIEDWPLIAKLRFVLEGRYAYAPGALDAIMDWIKDRSQDGKASWQ